MTADFFEMRCRMSLSRIGGKPDVSLAKHDRHKPQAPCRRTQPCCAARRVDVIRSPAGFFFWARAHQNPKSPHAVATMSALGKAIQKRDYVRAVRARIKGAWTAVHSDDPQQWSAYADLLTDTPASAVYAHDLHKRHDRGDVIERVVCRYFQGQGARVSRPLMPGRNYPAYDLDVDGRRVEVKSAALSFNKYDRSWVMRFKNIQWGAFDRLVLVMCLPDELRLYDYEGSVGKTTAGVMTPIVGGVIQLTCKRDDTFDASVAHVHAALQSMHLASIHIDDKAYADLIRRKRAGAPSRLPRHAARRHRVPKGGADSPRHRSSLHGVSNRRADGGSAEPRLRLFGMPANGWK